MAFTSLLGLVAVICSGLAVYTFFRTGYLPLWRWVVGGANRESEKYRNWAEELFMGWTPQQVQSTAVAARVSVIAATFVALVLTRAVVFGALIAAAMYYLPIMMFRFARERRLKRFDEQLPDAVMVMVASVRAGSPLPAAIEDVSLKMNGPVAEEFGVIYREHSSGGLMIEDALARAKARLPVESMTMISTALIINSGQGGDLLSVLERMSEAVRELQRLQKKIETETSEVRAQQKLILIMTPLFGIMSCLFDPAVPQILFHTFLGNILLGIVAVIEVACVLWIRHIIATSI